MTESAKTKHNEQRLPVVLSILFVVALLVMLPERIRLFPPWGVYAIAAVEIIPLVAVMLMPQNAVWLKMERIVTLLFCTFTCPLSIVNLVNIMEEMLKHSEDVSGMTLLLSGIGVWANNVLSFSLLYWIVDRGGPVRRSNNTATTPDWLFPQESAPVEDIPKGWRPAFIDYLFLGFCTGTAFSPTDILPLTHRAKLLVMLESLISLATVLVVLSRAINILG